MWIKYIRMKIICMRCDSYINYLYLTDKMKRSFFQAAVVSILLYGCTTWTLTKRMEKELEGNYTRILRAILNKSWRGTPHKAAKAWTAIDRLSVMWKSDLTDKMKRSFFQTVIVSIVLYGCITWTLTKRMEKNLDGNYTRMLWAILNKSWRQHLTKQQLYGHLPTTHNENYQN